MEEGAVFKVIRMSMDIISMRLLSILAMSMSFLLALWTMFDPSWERMGMAGFFAVCIYLPCISWERKKNETVNQKD